MSYCTKYHHYVHMLHSNLYYEYMAIEMMVMLMYSIDTLVF